MFIAMNTCWTRATRVRDGKDPAGRVTSLEDSGKAQVHWASVINGLPGTWTTETLAIARKPLTVTGLTPGTTYAFQVRAFGKAGWTDWSASSARMAI